jgi:predicted aspartyl protease
MGIFYVSCQVENPGDRSRTTIIPQMLVDTGSEHTWIPEAILKQVGIPREKKDLTFVMANGQEVTRSIGFAVVRCENFLTVDEVVFAEEGDLLLLGARTLEGFNVRVDSARKKLVASGPIPAAISKRSV